MIVYKLIWMVMSVLEVVLKGHGHDFGQICFSVFIIHNAVETHF